MGKKRCATSDEPRNMFRRDREYRQQQQQKIDRLERQIDALERKYPGTKFRA